MDYESDSDFVNRPPWAPPRGTTPGGTRKRRRMKKKSRKKSKKKHQQRWWRIGPSLVPRDPRFKDKSLGLGVFTTRPIKVRI